MKLTIEFSRTDWHWLKARATAEGRGSRAQVGGVIRDVLALYARVGLPVLLTQDGPRAPLPADTPPPPPAD